MKSTLTSADPSGWYEFACNSLGRQVAHWDGQYLRGGGYTFYQPNCKNFRRLFTESDVAALNEELRTLREELATNKHSLDVCGKYAESMQRSSEDYLNELRKEREENATLQNQADGLLKQAEQLEAELSRLKSQPYEMRRAGKPDCVGLWRNAHGDICKVKSDKDIDSFGEAPPYHYLGPIPVIVEQPPKVVKVKHKTSGEAFRAIPSPCGKWQAIIGNDGSFLGNESVDNWEEVPS